ncbi:MAG: NAD(P)H-dependent glycerol-3-phosphate dehydrogenase [Verrucomicrobiota bacterium]
MKVTFLGAGAWGSALAKLLRDNGHQVRLWDVNRANLEAIRSGQNEAYLPGVALPTDLEVETDFDRAVAGRDCIVLAIPSEFFRSVAARLGATRAILVSVTKGIEFETGDTMCEILQELAPKCPVAALSGPSFAVEVARGVPTAIVCASGDAATAQIVQSLFHRPTFRMYRSPDLRGVELGGALKNVIAIAAGVSDGLGFGDNTKAALITRGIAEIRRLGTADGAQTETFAGLSGIGDLTVTCFSKLSRNRSLGERLGRGETMPAILASAPKLAEGYPTARSAQKLARRLKVSIPIIDEVHAVCYEGKTPRQAVMDLMNRDVKAED